MAKNENSEWIKIYLDHSDKLEDRLSKSLEESEKRTNAKLKEHSDRLMDLSKLLDRKVGKTELGWILSIATVVIGFIAKEVFDVV